MRKTKFLGIWLLALSVCGSIGSDARAENVRADGFVGGLLGVSSANKNIGTGIGFGLNAGYFFHTNFGVGAFLRSANHDHDISSFFVGAEGLFRFTDTLPGLHLGVILGSGKFSNPAVDSSNSFAYGAKITYDYLLSTTVPGVSVGVDLSWMLTEPVNEVITTFSPMITGKFWF